MKFERLKQLRKNNHVTAQEVADLINLTNVTYRSYEIGTHCGIPSGYGPL